MPVKKDIFRFKQFAVAQEQTAMKVGTDGVLLGSWGDLNTAKNILDIGTGTGLIALMCAQKQPLANIDAIEIDPSAARQAVENFSDSKWSDRLRLIQTDFKLFVPQKQYDVIISNPPYFDEKTLNLNKQRNLARHNQQLSLETLISRAKKILKADGNIQLILPADKLNDLKHICQQEQLYLNKICYVKGHVNANVKRILVKISGIATFSKEKYLIIEHARHQYTEDYIRLTRDFYLKM